jgi:putative chitinase
MDRKTPVTEKIDGRILRLLGLTDVFDLDYSTYTTLLKECLLQVTAFGKKIPIEEVDILKSELKRVKSKKGRFKVKEKKLTSQNASNIKSFNSGNKKPLLLTGKVFAVSNSDDNKNKKPEVKKESKTGDLKKIILDIKKNLGSIHKTLENQFKLDKSINDKERIAQENEARGKKESGMEGLGKGIGTITKAAKKLLSPFQELIDRIFRFLFFVLLGRTFTKLVKWFSDPKNQKKVESLTRFFKTFFPAIAAGVFLFLTPFGKLVRTTIGLVMGGIPRLFRVIKALTGLRKGLNFKNLFDQAFGNGCGCGGGMPGRQGGTRTQKGPDGKTRNFRPGGPRIRFGRRADGGSVDAPESGGQKIEGSKGISISGAGRDNKLVPAGTGDVILTPEDQKKVSTKIGGDIKTNINGPRKENSDQLIAVRPGELKLTPEDQQKLYEKTGFDAAGFVADRKPKFVDSDKLKVAGQTQATSLGGIVQGFTNGGVVGGEQARADTRSTAPSTGTTKPKEGEGTKAPEESNKGNAAILAAAKTAVKEGKQGPATPPCASWVRMVLGMAGHPSQHKLTQKGDLDPEKKPWGKDFAASFAGTDMGQVMNSIGQLQGGDIVLQKNTFGNYPKGAITHVSIASDQSGKILHQSTTGGPPKESGLFNFGYGVRLPGSGVTGISTDSAPGSGPSGSGADGSGGGSGGGDVKSKVMDALMKGLGLGALFGSSGGGDNQTKPDGSSDPKIDPDSNKGTSNTSLNPNRKAMLDAIAFAEGTNKYPNSGYNTMFTGKQFSGYEKHPRQIQRSGRHASDAAGRYQFLSTTWNGLGLSDFTPKNQDVGAVKLLQRRNALSYVDNGDWPKAFTKARQEWASFPGAGYGQPEKSMDALVSYVKNRLSVYGNNSSNVDPKKEEKDKSGDPPKTDSSESKDSKSTGTATNSNLIQISSPDTGPGWSVKGLRDAQGRPAVFSQGGADAFYKMMQASNGAVKGSDIASSKRSPEKNKAVGGVSNSKHLGGNALDIHGSSQTWMRANGPKYGWMINDYPGSHGGHFDYKGAGANVGAASTDTSSDSSAPPSGPNATTGGGSGGGDVKSKVMDALVKGLGLGALYGSSSGGDNQTKPDGSSGGGGGGGNANISLSASGYKPLMIETMNKGGIKDKNERIMFMSQVGHESGEGKYLEEIASGSAYEGRADLGNTKPGDGKKFKGRGYIQITGRSNYAKYGPKVGVPDATERPEKLAEPQAAAKVALAYWMDRVNRSAAQKGLDGMNTVTRNINGGLNGLEDRIAKFKKYQNDTEIQKMIGGGQIGGLMDITSKMGIKYQHSAADNRMINVGDQKIAAQPGEKLFSFMIPKEAARRGAGEKITSYANSIVAQLDSNSQASKQLGLRGKGVDPCECIKPYSQVGGGQGQNGGVLPPITSGSGANGSMAQGGSQEVMFSPVCPYGFDERKRILDTLGVLTA